MLNKCYKYYDRKEINFLLEKILFKLYGYKISSSSK